MRFHEVQPFMSNRISWIAPAACVVALITMALSLAGPCDPRPAATLPLLLPLLILGGVLFLFWRGRMITDVDEDGLHVQVFPLTRRHHFAFDQLASCQARTYHPLREFGGWGVRCGRRGRAYNVSGDRGVQLVFRNGRRLLLGSQRAEELELAIRAGAQQRNVELTREA